MTTVNEIVEEVVNWFNENPEDAQQEFLNCPRSELAIYHHSLGRSIRNEFKLWEIKWEPELVDGVDHSPYHPDSVSMTIIEDVWDKLHEKE